MPTGPRLAGAVLAAAGLCGCTSTAQVASTPGFATTSDNGFAATLPTRVSVPPTLSRAGAFQTAAGTQPDKTAMTADAAATAPGFVPVSYAAPATRADRARREIDRLIAKYAALYAVPETLVRRVVKRESTFNPRAYNHGHWGLMQIKHATARGMGYHGPASGLFDAETNLKYAIKYLRGAWLVAAGDADRADRLYQRGYYYDAKRRGLLDETGLGHDAKRRRARAGPVETPPVRTPPAVPAAS